MTDGNEHVPPHSLEAEQGVLGSIIVEPACLADIPWVRPVHFYGERHQVIFRTCQALAKDLGRVDLLLLVDSLKASGDLERAGGAAYLAQLADEVPSPLAVGHYARRVADLARDRALIAGAGEMRAALMAGGPQADAAIVRMQRMLARADDLGRQTVASMGELVRARMDQITRFEQQSDSIPTGLEDLDRLLGGWYRTDLVLIAARPSMGKTALLLQILASLGSAGYASALGSCEMSKESLPNRLFANAARVEHRRIRTNSMSEIERRDVIGVAGDLFELPIQVDDAGGITPASMMALYRRCVREHGKCDALGIDYLQLMHPSVKVKGQNRQETVASISAELKELAKECRVPVLTLCQLNRRVEQRTGPWIEPTLSDLRESGALEQDADVVVLLWTNEQNKAKDVIQVTLTVAKNRQGPLGKVRLVFDKRYQRFEPEETRWQPE